MHRGQRKCESWYCSALQGVISPQREQYRERIPRGGAFISLPSAGATFCYARAGARSFRLRPKFQIRRLVDLYRISPQFSEHRLLLRVAGGCCVVSSDRELTLFVAPYVGGLHRTLLWDYKRLPENAHDAGSRVYFENGNI
jgi:hypothetical protein